MRSGNERERRIGSVLLCLFLTLPIGVSLGCTSGNEKAELKVLELALASLASAPREDREIRLEELRAVPVGSARLARIKEKCISSHETFMRSERFLADAKAKTRQVETLLAGARSRSAKGEEITGEAESRIRSYSDDAAALLEKATKALGQAETFVDQCRKERVALNRLLAGQDG